MFGTIIYDREREKERARERERVRERDRLCGGGGFWLKMAASSI